MMCFVIISCLLRASLTIVLGFCVVWFDHWLSKMERVGMGMMGGAGLLTVPVIYYTAVHIKTPYDGWAACLFTAGALVFFIGWAIRKRKHDVANAASVRQAQEHFARKGER